MCLNEVALDEKPGTWRRADEQGPPFRISFVLDPPRLAGHAPDPSGWIGV